jgi:hypothetical protein
MKFTPELVYRWYKKASSLGTSRSGLMHKLMLGAKRRGHPMFRLSLVAVAIAAWSALAAANDDDFKAESAIRGCASMVRSQGYSWFNAVYDRVKKTVQTNIQPGDQEKAISPFEKCLISQGVFIQLSR